jgi:hypothetical protein
MHDPGSALGIALEERARRRRLIARLPERERRRALGLPAAPIDREQPAPRSAVVRRPPVVFNHPRLRPATSPGGEKIALAALAAVSKAFEVSVEAIRGDRRFTELVKARHAVAVILRSLKWSFPNIGAVMRRDHTSIVHTIADPRGIQADTEWRTRFESAVALFEGANPPERDSSK